MPDLRRGNGFLLPSRRISRSLNRSGTNLVIFLGALCAQITLFWREMKIKKMYLKPNASVSSHESPRVDAGEPHRCPS